MVSHTLCTMETFTACGHPRTDENTGWDKRGRDVASAYCRVCKRARIAKYKREHPDAWKRRDPDKQREANIKWYNAHRDQAKEDHDKWVDNNRDHVKEWRRENYRQLQESKGRGILRGDDGFLEYRFWMKVSKTDACWEWTAAKNRKGYGIFSVNGKPRFAHQVAYESAIGPLTAGRVVDHLCANQGCVNPDHLEAVSPADNTYRGKEPHFEMRGQYLQLSKAT